jgi:hypothetical protein
VPRTGYVGPVGDFAAAQSSLGTAVKSDVEAAPTTDRIEHVRRQVYSIAFQAESARPNIAVRSPSVFMCEGIVWQGAVAFDQSYVATTATNLSAIAKPPPEKFEDLVKQLGERYQIRVDDKFRSDEARTACLKQYDSPDKWMARYPAAQPGQEAVTEIIGVAQDLYALVAKLGQIILTEIDDARRAKALKDYFGNKEATKELRDNIERLRKILKTRLDIDRAKAHQAYEAAYAPLPKLLYSMSAQGVGACVGWRSSPKTVEPATDPNFRACYDALWAKVEPTLEKALAAAAKYDPLMLAKESDAFNALEKSIAKMEQLADGKIDNLEELKLIVQAAVKVFTAVDQVKKTIESDDTKAVLKKVDALLAKYH